MILRDDKGRFISSEDLRPKPTKTSVKKDTPKKAAVKADEYTFPVSQLGGLMPAMHGMSAIAVQGRRRIPCFIFKEKSRYYILQDALSGTIPTSDPRKKYGVKWSWTVGEGNIHAIHGNSITDIFIKDPTNGKNPILSRPFAGYTPTIYEDKKLVTFGCKALTLDDLHTIHTVALGVLGSFYVEAGCMPVQVSADTKNVSRMYLNGHDVNASEVVEFINAVLLSFAVYDSKYKKAKK